MKSSKKNVGKRCAVYHHGAIAAGQSLATRDTGTLGEYAALGDVHSTAFAAMHLTLWRISELMDGIAIAADNDGKSALQAGGERGGQWRQMNY